MKKFLVLEIWQIKKFLGGKKKAGKGFFFLFFLFLSFSFFFFFFSFFFCFFVFLFFFCFFVFFFVFLFLFYCFVLLFLFFIFVFFSPSLSLTNFIFLIFFLIFFLVIQVKPTSILCSVKCKSKKEYKIFSCISGNVIEFNNRLLTPQVNLLLKEKVFFSFLFFSFLFFSFLFLFLFFLL